MRGLFITVEGLEGVGKSTNLSFVRDHLEAAGVAVEVTREPGGTPLAEKIREVVLGDVDEAMPAVAEVLLMFAARAVHVENRIRPALNAGRWVVCDRFTDATFAYQGHARQVGPEWVADLANRVHGDLWPDCTLLLDAPVEVGRGRARLRGPEDRIEREQSEFFQSVRDGYLARAQAEPNRFRVIDATHPLEQVQREIALALDALIARAKS